MSESMRAYFEMLKSLTSVALDRSAQELAVREKQEAACLIAHIAEIGERRYHLELGYKNIFEYCVERLNLSEGSVYRRTQVAGVCQRFPRILEAISGGRLHLTAASLIAPHLTEDNVERLIGTAQGKTKRQVEAFLVSLAPKETFAPSVRKQPSGEKNPDPPAPHGDEPERKPPAPSGAQRTRDLVEPATDQRYNFRFRAGKEFAEKFDRLAEVLGIESPHNHLEEIFDLALESALDKKDPKRKLERRREREARNGTSHAACPGEAVQITEKPRQEDETAHNRFTAEKFFGRECIRRSMPGGAHAGGVTPGT